jgi:hypothetical protein
MVVQIARREKEERKKRERWYNINFITSVGVQGCDRQPSVRRVLWLAMQNKLSQD